MPSAFREKIGGLLGSPEFKDALYLTLASGADPRRAAYLRDQRAQEEDWRAQEEMRQFQMEQARAQMEAAKERQQRQQWTQATLGAAASQNPGLLSDPTFQAKLRMQAAAYGDPAMLEAGGLLSTASSSELPADARLYEWAKNDPERMKFIQRNGQTASPAVLQEWAAYNSMSPEQRAQFLQMKRAGQMYDVGGVPALLTASGASVPLATPEAVAANEAEQAKARAQGTAAGEAAGSAVGKAASIDDAINAVSSIKGDPAIRSAYGVVMGRAPTIRQDTQNFIANRDRVVNAISLAERGELKGAGQITDFEQKMLAGAKTILQNPYISPELAADEINRIDKWLREKRGAMTKIVPQSSPAQSASSELDALRRKHGLQ